ncbi:competence type IV pilus minor pilin ComGF [Bacillus sp. SH5-2]|uniref:competence type IV pilus minor pilin ComGF n=1 Tax=Bacillus sp. SH5-2 TaxID=2217834 RepID=UPI0011ED0BA7|nr:competence type IV pilus minor pilin ComGF [Bacillus sp. SH5-2]KAA0762624.1 prepilin-type N-terminal cleavage/methylation domain-containing protein [Bacillus sp. SH5-2]
MLLCRRKNKLEAGFTLLEMIVCLFLVSMFFLLLPRLHFIGLEHSQKGLSDWEWDVFIGQVQLEFRGVLFGEHIAFDNRDSILRFRLRDGEQVTYEKINGQLIRKINMRGREVVLQKVGMISYKLTPHLLFIYVEDASGKIHEGVAVRYSVMSMET